MMVGKNVKISVIIPALNEEAYIRNAFDGLRDQDFRDFEIIVVDGGSNDRTREIARKHAKVVVLRKIGAGRARNLGARLAKGNLLLFIDADTRPAKGLLRTYSNIMKDRSIAAVTGPILPLEKAGAHFILGYALVSILFVRLSILVGRPSFMGSNFAVRRKAFRNVHGFVERMMTYEDWDLSNRLKRQGRMVYSGKALVHTSVRRVKKWGMLRYFAYYVVNIFRYHVWNDSNKTYKPIR